jgi:hypothetical protein
MARPRQGTMYGRPRLHILVRLSFQHVRPILMVHTKNENKTGFVFVRVKIVMHGLTATQEFCKLSNVRI